MKKVYNLESRLSTIIQQVEYLMDPGGESRGFCVDTLHVQLALLTSR